MFKQIKPPAIRSLIAHGTAIQGTVEFVEGLRIDGEIVGSVFSATGSPGILVISESAKVRGEIDADHVIVNGEVSGPIRSRSLIEIQPKARIHGDITYRALEMHAGAVIQGRLIVQESVAHSANIEVAARENPAIFELGTHLPRTVEESGFLEKPVFQVTGDNYHGAP